MADSGAEHTSGLAFSRESLMRITGPFGQVAFGRMGALGFAQSTAILRGWAFGTSWGASAWSVGNVHFGRLNNAVNYVTPSFSGLTLHATYSNGTTNGLTMLTTTVLAQNIQLITLMQALFLKLKITKA